MDNEKRLAVELWYDPVKPETYVKIGGRFVDSGDIYGFLYPVRQCVMQAWLYESGSWPGLRRQLTELARGEGMELTFHGRTCDFSDLSGSLAGWEDVELKFQPWQRDGEYLRELDELEKQVRALLREKTALDMSRYDLDMAPERSLTDLFPERGRRIEELLDSARAGGEEEWLSAARSPGDLRALRSGRGCVAIYETALGSFEALGMLRTLTGSMQRSPDMLACILNTKEERDDYAAYAAQFPGPRPVFTYLGDQSCLGEMREKYGRPLALRRRVEAMRGAIGETLACWGDAGELERRQNELEARKLTRREDVEELNRCRMARQWLTRRRARSRKLEEAESGEDSLISPRGGRIDD